MASTADRWIYRDKTVEELAIEILAGKWGNNHERQRRITALYGKKMYTASQERANAIVSTMNRHPRWLRKLIIRIRRRKK